MNTILIVDDENDIIEIISEYVKNSGYNVLTANNGSEALKIFKENNNIDLIILDIMMPDFDGYYVANAIRKNKNIPIIMLSAKSEVEDKLKGFEIGVVDYVTKPFSPRELIARVRVNLTREQNKDDVNIDEYSFDGVVINRIAKKVFVDGETIELTIKEYELLCNSFIQF